MAERVDHSIEAHERGGMGTRTGVTLSGSEGRRELAEDVTRHSRTIRDRTVDVADIECVRCLLEIGQGFTVRTCGGLCRIFWPFKPSLKFENSD